MPRGERNNKIQRRGQMASALLACTAAPSLNAVRREDALLGILEIAFGDLRSRNPPLHRTKKDDFAQKPSFSLSYIRIRIHLVTVDQDFKMKMRTRRVTR